MVFSLATVASQVDFASNPDRSLDGDIFVVPLQGYVTTFERPGALFKRGTLSRSFCGNVTLGSPPQQFLMLVDTGSNNLWVPSEDCVDVACCAHQQYWPELSSMAVELTEMRRMTTSFGAGSILGYSARDTLCFNGVRSVSSSSQPDASACVSVSFFAARHMSDFPFMQEPFDGILGLGAPKKSEPISWMILQHLAEEGFHIFSIRFNTHELWGELIFASDCEAVVDHLATGPVSWVPLAANALDRGRWMVRVLSVTIDGTSLRCGGGPHDGCNALVDTGSTWMLGPPAGVQELRKIAQTLDCTQVTQHPHILFEASGSDGSFTIELAPRDVVESRATKDGCIFTFDEHHSKDGSDLWVFGQPLLQNYVTIFDLDSRRVGFATAGVRTATEAV